MNLRNLIKTVSKHLHFIFIFLEHLRAVLEGILITASIFSITYLAFVNGTLAPFSGNDAEKLNASHC